MTCFKLCLIGKYPPIQGGLSRRMYWLARCFAELGNQVHFVIATAKAVRTQGVTHPRSHLVNNQTDLAVYEYDFLAKTNIVQFC